MFGMKTRICPECNHEAWVWGSHWSKHQVMLPRVWKDLQFSADGATASREWSEPYYWCPMSNKQFVA